MAVVNTATNTPLGNQGTNQADFGGKALAGNEWTQGHPARVGDKVRRALHVQMKPLYTLEVLAAHSARMPESCRARRIAPGSVAWARYVRAVVSCNETGGV